MSQTTCLRNAGSAEKATLTGPPCVQIKMVKSFGCEGSIVFGSVVDEELLSSGSVGVSPPVKDELEADPFVYGVEGGKRSSQKLRRRSVNASKDSILAMTSGDRLQ